MPLSLSRCSPATTWSRRFLDSCLLAPCPQPCRYKDHLVCRMRLPRVSNRGLVPQGAPRVVQRTQMCEAWVRASATTTMVVAAAQSRLVMHLVWCLSLAWRWQICKLFNTASKGDSVWERKLTRISADCGGEDLYDEIAAAGIAPVPTHAAPKGGWFMPAARPSACVVCALLWIGRCPHVCSDATPWLLC